jgi:hypothetical protein
MIRAALTWLLSAPVVLYRRYLSPLKRVPTCRFLPTCSEYALESLRVHGPVRGAGRAAWRIARCNPLSKGGFDPVPPCSGRHPGGPRAPAHGKGQP